MRVDRNGAVDVVADIKVVLKNYAGASSEVYEVVCVKGVLTGDTQRPSVQRIYRVVTVLSQSAQVSGRA